MPDRPRNVGASVRQRLLNLAQTSGQPMELLLTRDVDLLGFGNPAHDALLATFREVMAIEVDDGVSFDLEDLRIDAIREELEYGGSRLRTTAALAGARIPITVDIGFGDAVEPGVEDIDLPVLLDMPSPHLRAYPPETVIAEKLHAMVILGRANSRMKDYYDVWMLANAFELDAARIRKAVVATFARRSTELSTEIPDGLSEAFASDPAKQRQWDAFARNLSRSVPELDVIVGELQYRLAGLLTST